MNKSKLIELVAAQSEISKKNAEQAVNVIFTTLKDALIEGERIEIRGFGSFITKEYRAYTGRNPRTGRAIHVPAKRLPFFKVGKDLRERINDDCAARTRPLRSSSPVSPSLPGARRRALPVPDSRTRDERRLTVGRAGLP